MTVDKRVRQAETQEIVGRVRCYRVLCSDVNTSLGDFSVSSPSPFQETGRSPAAKGF